jgi:hypothetical protein
VTRILLPSFFSGTTNADIYSEKIITLHFQNLRDEENKYGFFQQDNIPARKADYPATALHNTSDDNIIRLVRRLAVHLFPHHVTII